MKVCGIITNFNYGRYLPDAINSLRNQTHPCDIAVYDDGSTDNSYDVISRLEQEIFDRRFIVEYGKETRGPSCGRNVLLRRLIDEYDAFLIQDADDIAKPNKVEELVRILIKYPDSVGVVYGDYDIFDENTGVTVREYKKSYSKELLDRECCVHSNALISVKALKSVVENNQYYDESLRCAEDFDVFQRVSERFMIIHVPKSLTLVRNHSGNSTSSVSKEIWNQCWQRVYEKRLGRLRQHG